MRQVEQQAAAGLAHDAADDLGQVGGTDAFVGVGRVVLRDDALGAEAADDRGHVGDQPLGDQIAVGRIIGVQRHPRIGSWRRDHVDVDQRCARLRQERLDLAPVRRLPGLAVARAADAVADEEREVDVDRAERLCGRDQVGPGGGLEVIEVDVAAAQQIGGRVTVVDGESDGQRSLALSSQMGSRILDFRSIATRWLPPGGWRLDYNAPGQRRQAASEEDVRAHGGLTVIGI